MIINHSDALGQAYFYYNEYVNDAKKKGEEPVGFFKFLIGRR